MRPSIPLAVILSACTPEAKSAADVELCRTDVRAKFHKAADECDTEECIDALSAKELAGLKECR